MDAPRQHGAAAVMSPTRWRWSCWSRWASAVGGTVSGWLVARRRFPGSAFPRMGIAAAAGDAVVRDGLCVHRFPAVRRPGADGIARDVRLVARTTTGFPTCARCGGAATMFVFALYPYVYLLARTAFVERPPALIEAARTLGLDRRAGILARRAAARASGHRRRHRAGADGNAGRLRNGRVFRRRHVHHRHLPRVVLAGRSRGRRAARHGASRVRHRSRSRSNGRHAARGARTGGARGRQTSRFAPARLTGLRGWGATIICAIPLLVGFVLPGALLLRLAVRRCADVVLTDRFFGWAWNSLRVALDRRGARGRGRDARRLRGRLASGRR